MSALALAPAEALAPEAAPRSPLVLSAGDKRARQPLLGATWSLAALVPRLPMGFPVDPPCPPRPSAAPAPPTRPQPPPPCPTRAGGRHGATSSWPST